MVLDNEQYIMMCMKILNKTWYVPVTTTKIDKFEQEFYQLVDAAFQHTLLSKNEWEFICTPFSRTPTFSHRENCTRICCTHQAGPSYQAMVC